MRSKRKLSVYKEAKRIYLKIQKAIDSGVWIVLMDDHIISPNIVKAPSKPRFVFDDVKQSINVLQNNDTYLEIISNDNFEDPLDTLCYLDKILNQTFLFIKNSELKVYSEL